MSDTSKVLLDAFKNPIVFGQRYRISSPTLKERTFATTGTALKIMKGAHGTKITMSDLVCDVFEHGVLQKSVGTPGTVSAYPCHMFPVPKDANE